MGRYLVLESCKAGPGVYLMQGQVVDVKDFEGLSPKFVELAASGLLMAASQVSLEIAPEPVLAETPEPVQEPEVKVRRPRKLAEETV